MPSAVCERGMESSLMELLLIAKQRENATASMDRNAEVEADGIRIHTSLEVRYCLYLRAKEHLHCIQKCTLRNCIRLCS